jgi:hypothetical protein
VTFDVHDAALSFAQDLADTLDSVLPVPSQARSGDREVQVKAGPHGRYSIRMGERYSRVILVNNALPVAAVRIDIRCTEDSVQRYLAVQKSSFEFQALGDRTPLLRLDYDRAAHTVPSAHWNVHGERGAVSHLLARTAGGHAGGLSDLHLTVGGARHRPCLEDFLDLLIHEFHFDTRSGFQAVLNRRREEWRRRQTGALVRDAPDEAVRVLRDLGYGVTEPATGPASPNVEALRRR